MTGLAHVVHPATVMRITWAPRTNAICNVR